MRIPSYITTFPAAFASIAARVNFLLKFANIVSNAQGKNGIRVLVTDNNMVIENDPDGGDADGSGGVPIGGGGGLPEGYGPEEFTICENGAPALRNFITDNPD
jgi:hypothetical protein